jgi:hypothetical protein
MSDVEERIEQWREDLAGSELLGRADVSELENHVREEMERLQAAGLSGEEAFLLARHRLGDPASLEEEFAKVSPHRRLTGRLSWMAIGILAYYLALYVSICLSNASTVLGYLVGLRHPFLSVVACAMYVAAFAGMGALLWRYLASHAASRVTKRKAPISLAVGLLAACAIVALSFVSLLSHTLAFRIIPSEGSVQVALAQGWVSSMWFTLMPFLLVGLLALLALRDRHRAQTL